MTEKAKADGPQKHRETAEERQEHARKAVRGGNPGGGRIF